MTKKGFRRPKVSQQKKDWMRELDSLAIQYANPSKEVEERKKLLRKLIAESK